jgi:large subunit ribosomal protein L16
MLRIPSSSKFKHTFNRYPENSTGNKGFSYAKTAKLAFIAKQSHLFSPKHVEIWRRYLNKTVKESGGALDIRIFPAISCSKKPLQTRMGKGKGRPSHFVDKKYSGMPLAFIHNRIELHKLRQGIARVQKRSPIEIKIKVIRQFSPKLKSQFLNNNKHNLTICYEI